MANPGLTKNKDAETDIPARRIVKHGNAAGSVALASASTDKLAGVSERAGYIAAGRRVDVIKNGIAEVEYGGAVAAGDPLTADADGRAIAATPAVGSNNTIIGFAEISGAAGDYGLVLIAPCIIQG